MSTPQQPEEQQRETGTALAVTEADRNALPEEANIVIAQRKMRNIVSAKIAGTNWGKGMDAETRRAVADWLDRNRIDVSEIFVLGGNIYLNASFYINRLAHLQQQGKVRMARPDLIHIDARLDAKVPAEAEEIARRRQQRIIHGCPDDAIAACVFRLELTAMPGVELTGAKWTGNKGRDASKDPVGNAFPIETVITRAARRCLKFAIPYLPEVAEWISVAIDDAKATIGEVLERSHETQMREIADAKARGQRDLRVAAPEYAEGRMPALPAGAADRFAQTGNVYGDAEPTAQQRGEAPAPAQAAATPAPASAPTPSPLDDEDDDQLGSLTAEERAALARGKQV